MSTTARSEDEINSEAMMCSYNDRTRGGACFETATHSYRPNAQPDREEFACERHARWLVDAGLTDEKTMKKLRR